MEEDTRSLAALHLAVMLFGLSAILGRFVTVPAVLVAGGRVVCSAALLLVLCLGTRTPLALHSRRDTALALGTGVVLAIHWTTFFQAIQCSSVALGTISFSTFPLFVTFLEPLVFREPLRPRSVLRAAPSSWGWQCSPPCGRCGDLCRPQKFPFTNQKPRSLCAGTGTGALLYRDGKGLRYAYRNRRKTR